MVSAASGKSSAVALCRIVFFRSAVYSRYSGFRGSSAKPFIFRSGVRASGRPRTGPNVVGPLSDRCRNAVRILSERCQNVVGPLSECCRLPVVCFRRLRNLRLNSAVDFAIAFGNSRRNSGCGFCSPHSGTCNGNSGRAVSVSGYCRVRLLPRAVSALRFRLRGPSLRSLSALSPRRDARSPRPARACRRRSPAPARRQRSSVRRR